MTSVLMLTIISVVVGFYMAWSIGANDVANAMGTSVGSGALTLRRAVLLAAVFEFLGAFLAGSYVTETVQKKIVIPEMFIHDPMVWVYGMIAALLAAAVWLQAASYFGWPVSTTHSIIGAILGFGLVAGGVDAIQWDQLSTILLSWVISPLMGGGISFMLFTIMRRQIFYARDPIAATRRFTPWIVFVFITFITLFIAFKGLKNLHLNITPFQTVVAACGFGLVCAIFSRFLIRRLAKGHTDAPTEARPNAQTINGLQKAQKHLGRVYAGTSGELQAQVGHVLGEVEEIAHNLQHVRVLAE